ncbi:MAG: ABC transporter ATP-binding protein [Ruminococcaceae bacterium]|nr:ABC transporter ATP-binding protein [Oscillospiraceae bacterium]
MAILECQGLYKAYQGNKYVLNNMELSVPEGKIVGLLGPNGCGKSTFIKMVAGLLIPTKGEIFVDGRPVGDETKAIVSYLPERTYFNSWMKVEGIIKFFSEFYSDFDSERAYSLMRDLNIDTGARLKTLSKGTKEKIQLILVMSRRAKLYLLDEPIAGVDPAAREYILGTIVGNYDPSATVIITTHLISDVEQILDEFMFMGYGGVILRSGSAEEVREAEGRSLDELFREVFRCSAN